MTITELFFFPGRRCSRPFSRFYCTPACI